MNLTDYQYEAMQFARYKEDSYPRYALVEEVGELFKHFAKQARGDEAYATLDKGAIASEMGDILWDMAAIANDLGLDLGRIAVGNLIKLSERERKGNILGDGDNR